MISLGIFKPGDTVFYGANFHNDTGALEDPTGVAARLRDTGGTWTDLTTPTKQDGKTGFYGGSFNTIGYTPGQYVIRLSGTVTAAKNVARNFGFILRANTEKDIYDRIGAPTGATISEDLAGKPTLVQIEASTKLLQKTGGSSTNLVIVESDNRVRANAAAAGFGAIQQPVRVKDSDGNLVDGAEVWVTSDVGGANVVAGVLQSDADGMVTFMLDPGSYYLWAQRSGVNFTNPTPFNV